MYWYFHALKNYATFSGRARRKEYWMFVLISLLITSILVLIDSGGNVPEPGEFLFLSSIYSIIVFLPGLAVFIRRLHDTGRSAWWLLIGLMPLLGGLVLLVFMCLDSDRENRYGSNPKTMAADINL
jgi:uncharacterized membrane protein YhaH (DUF805 family)